MLVPPPILTTLRGEPLPLDLVNTRFRLPEGWVDLLDDPEHRTGWLTAEAARLGTPMTEEAAGGAELAVAVRRVREHVAAALEPARLGRRPPANALAGLNEAVRAAPAVPEVRWDGEGIVTTTGRSGSLAARVAASFAEAAVDLLADPAVRRVRRCDAPSCVIVFLPRHPNRRWCTPSVCGNRARVARYYLRHRSEQGGAPA